jgi:hypothetical protein
LRYGRCHKTKDLQGQESLTKASHTLLGASERPSKAAA